MASINVPDADMTQFVRDWAFPPTPTLHGMITVGRWRDERVCMQGFKADPDAVVAAITATEAHRALFDCAGVPKLVHVLQAPPDVRTMGTALIFQCATLGTLDAVLDKMSRAQPSDARFEAERAAVLLHMGKSLLHTLAECHSRGVAHKNLQDRSIHACLPDDGGPPTWMLMDFGLAEVVDATTGSIPLHSTKGILPPFAAPEVLSLRSGELEYWATHEALGTLDARAVDVWAFGSLMLMLWNGVLPWNRADLTDNGFMDFVEADLDSQRHTTAPGLPWQRSLPPLVLDMVTQCLATDPAARPTAATLARHPVWDATPEYPTALRRIVCAPSPMKAVRLQPLHAEPGRVGVTQNGQWVGGDTAPASPAWSPDDGAPVALAPASPAWSPPEVTAAPPAVGAEIIRSASIPEPTAHQLAVADAPRPKGATILDMPPAPQYTAQGVRVWPEGSPIG